MKEYDEGRIWYRRKGKVVMVGVTEKAIDEIGGVQAISLPLEGDEVNQDDVVGEIEGSKVTFEIISPVDGAIEAVNDSLSSEYEVLEQDPLDEGWLFRVKMAANDDEDEDEESEDEE